MFFHCLQQLGKQLHTIMFHIYIRCQVPFYWLSQLECQRAREEGKGLAVMSCKWNHLLFKSSMWCSVLRTRELCFFFCPLTLKIPKEMNSGKVSVYERLPLRYRDLNVTVIWGWGLFLDPGIFIIKYKFSSTSHDPWVGSSLKITRKK